MRLNLLKLIKNLFESYDNIPRQNELIELKRVTPKAGRVVIFNGRHWHTSNQPEYDIRCVVNYNVV